MQKASKVQVSKVQYGGLSAWGFLAALWLTLKLGGVTEIANWSWFWVLSPIWIWWAVALVLAGIVGLSSASRGDR